MNEQAAADVVFSALLRLSNPHDLGLSAIYDALSSAVPESNQGVPLSEDALVSLRAWLDGLTVRLRESGDLGRCTFTEEDLAGVAIRAAAAMRRGRDPVALPAMRVALHLVDRGLSAIATNVDTIRVLHWARSRDVIALTEVLMVVPDRSQALAALASLVDVGQLGRLDDDRWLNLERLR